MHTHDELPVHPSTSTVGHHFTSTYPTIHFRNMLMLTKHLDGRHLAVTHETLTGRRPGQPTQHRELRGGELSDLLEELAVPLTADEREALLARVSGLRADSMTSVTGPGPAHRRGDDGRRGVAARVVAGPERDACVAAHHGDLG